MEIAIIIVIIILVVTEFLKYTSFFGIAPYLSKKDIYDDCQYAKEAFYERDLYKRNIDDRYKLRFW